MEDKTFEPVQKNHVGNPSASLLDLDVCHSVQLDVEFSSLEQLKLSKKKFIAELKKKEKGLEKKSTHERMKALVEKSEMLANYLLTKHKFVREGRSQQVFFKK